MDLLNNRKNDSIIWLSVVLAGCLLIGVVSFYYFESAKQDMVTVGISRWDSNPEFERNVEGFKQGLAENGYEEGKNIRFIIENPVMDLDKQRQIITSFIQAKVDLVYSITTPGTGVAKELTSQMKSPVPVVFSVCTYPVESKLIASLTSSDNNLVGTRNYVPFAQQYYVFERIFPDTKTLAVVHRKGESNSIHQFEDVKEVLAKRGIEVVEIAAVDLDDIRRQLEANNKTIDAIFSTCDTLTHHSGGEEIIIEFSRQYNKPSFACNKEGVLRGHLVGNVVDFKTIGRISGEKAALILKGSKPTWLTTESSRENYIVINQRAADALGLKIPPDLLEIAKEIIRE